MRYIEKIEVSESMRYIEKIEVSESMRYIDKTEINKYWQARREKFGEKKLVVHFKETK